MARSIWSRVACVCGLGLLLAACAAGQSYRQAEIYADEVPAAGGVMSTGEYYAEGDAAGADMYAPEPQAAPAAEAERGVGISFDGLFAGKKEARPSPRRRAPAPSAPLSPAPPPPAPAPGQPLATDQPAPGSGADAPIAPAPERGKRLMIYRANYQIIVSSVDKSIDELLTMVKTRGGYLEARQNNTLTLRVPAELYFEVLDLLPRFGRITQQNLQAVDVTRHYADLQLRIANARASRDRLAKLLDQATRMEDIIKIEAELRRLTEEIERLEGELRGLGDQIAFSTLVVTFMPNAPDPNPYPTRQYSRFDWINQVGLEAVQYGF